MSEAGLRGRSAMLSTEGEMYSLNLPLIRLRAVSQRLGDGGLTGRVTVLGGNGDDAFLFWATCSTGTSMVTGGSTGAVGGRVDPRGRRVGRIHPSRPRPGRPGWRSWAPVTRRARHQLWTPWTSLEAPGWAGGGTKDGTAAGSLAAGFGSPLAAPGALGFFPLVLFLLLSP